MQAIARLSLLLYPLIAHLGILMHQVKWPVIYLAIVVFLNSLQLFSRHKLIGLCLTILVCALLYGLLYSDAYASILYLPPVLIPSWLAIVFLGSLQKDRAAISIIAERIEGKALDAQHMRYTRRLTLLWGLIFVFMVIEAITLAIWASYETWSWWVNIGNYIVVAVLILGEILLRPMLIGRRVPFGQTFKALLLRDWHR